MCWDTTGGPHKLCDRLYFEFIEAMYGNIENPRIIVKSHSIRANGMRSKIHTCQPTVSLIVPFWLDDVRQWHVWILLRIPVARILWDFDFLRGLAPGRLDGFSIGRYEKNRKSFDLYAVKFEIGAMRFLGEKSLPRWNPFKTRIPPFSLDLLRC